MSIRIISLNVRGLRDGIKRRMIFNFYRTRTDILCLQETHSDRETEKLWTSEWGGDAFYSHGTTNSCGVAILTPKGFQKSVYEQMSSKTGRFLNINFWLNEQKVSLIAIYGPNTDDSSFFQRVERICENTDENKIIIGDFNLVLNPNVDHIGSIAYKHKSINIIEELIENYLLEDIWKLRNGDARTFSWFRSKPKLQASRIDFALVSKGLCDLCENTGYLTGIRTDHLAFYVFINMTKNDRGPGYWKLNVNHIQRESYLQIINKTIDEVLLSSRKMDPAKLWEYLKYCLRKVSQDFSKNCASDRALIISQLSEKVTKMELNLLETNTDILFNTKAELGELLEEDAKGSMFRAKVRYLEYGEKPTKYFFNLEKARYNAKTCNTLFDQQDNLVPDTDGILKLQEKFYRRLYTKDETVHFKWKNDTNIKLSDEMSLELNSPFSIEELGIAVKELPNGKTCGNDGLPIDLYKVIWGKIKGIFHDMVNFAYDAKKLHHSALIGVINLIAKQKKDSRHLKNLRPITLLNSDYKIIEKAIAKRMELALPNIICDDQLGFMKGRRIHTNIRMIYELMTYSDSNNIEALILSLEFEKCFDRIEHQVLLACLEFFNFPEYLITWTEILYSGFKANTQNNGYFSNRISVGRGLHQGGPCSSLYFLVCVETMAILLRQNENIKGIPVEDILNLLGQYADDADVYLLNDQKSLDSVFLCLQRFKQMSGFSVNYDKTSIYRIGSLKHSNRQLQTQKLVLWTNEPINVPGVWIAHNQDQSLNLNYALIFDQMCGILQSWRCHNLSLFGKILVVNTLVASLFVYKMTVLPAIPHNLRKQVREEIEKFLWNGSRPKIKYDVLTKSKYQGGAHLIDFDVKDKSLKITWIQILAKEPKLKNIVYKNINCYLGERIWECSMDQSEVNLITQNPFWCEVLAAWFSFKKCFPETHPSKQIIWLNERIRVNNKPILWRKPIDSGLWYVDQLFCDGVPIAALNACRTYDLTLMEYNSVISSIPKEWRKSLGVGGSVDGSWYQCMLCKPNLSQYAYQVFVDQEIDLSSKIDGWEAELDMSIPRCDFLRCFKDIYLVTNIPKQRSFQYRLLHRAIITNIHLCHWKFIENNLCTFFKSAPESYTHLLIHCIYVKNIWLHLEKFMYVFNLEHIHFAVDTVMCNRIVQGDTGNVKNLICALLKQYVYRKRCFKELPLYEEFVDTIWSFKNIEKYIATRNNKLSKHYKKWADKKQDNEQTIDEYINTYINDM